MTVPFVDLRAQYLDIKSEIDALRTFLITRLGLLKFKKCTPSL